MIEIVKNFPQMYSEEPVEVKLNLTKKYSKIVICGMGGSGFPAKFIKDLYNLPIEIVQNYNLPKINDETLVICTSHSGNTEETISCLKQAGDAVVIASGGKMLEGRNKNYVKIKGGVPPRFGFPHLLKATFIVLEKAGFLKTPEINFEDFKKMNEAAKKLSEKIYNKIPIIWTAKYESLLNKIKIGFNENSKIPSWYNLFPELDHNEVVGFGNKDLRKNIVVIILRNNSEHPRIALHIETIKDLLKDKVEIIEYYMQGKNEIDKVLNTEWFFSMCSSYLAEKYGVDTRENLIIDELKRRMSG